jgi:hypothetical protein
MTTEVSRSPAWAKRKEPTDLPALLRWFEKDAGPPHLAVLAPDRCEVSAADTNTGKTIMQFVGRCALKSTKELARSAELLWDETCRACEWLADRGYHDAPIRPPKTMDPDESLRQYRLVQQYLRSKIESANSANTSKLFCGIVPTNPDLVDLAVRIDAEPKDSKRSWNEIARNFTGETNGTDTKAKSLLSQLRRMKRQGRVNL